ncbi:MAG: coenzyme F420-0:L-glutamate ligase [Oscillospiraceae bacterium]|nr:coenzyme F420-0:L-glutamate ligase [Oscillospiraceae bacterium]
MVEQAGLRVNPGKNEIVQSDKEKYLCHAIKTRVVKSGDSLADIIDEYAKMYLQKGDIIFLSEKMVACAQGRALPLTSIKPGFTAKFLSKFVTRSSAGIGLAMPETMQCALKECGYFRILFASAAGMFGKLFGKKGWFYKAAGYRAACIDGPCDYTIPPYNEYVVLSPLDPDLTAANIAERLDGVTVLIVDINDLGGNILGSSGEIDKNNILDLLRQNPLGQSCQSTPIGILRKIEDEKNINTGGTIQ